MPTRVRNEGSMESSLISVTRRQVDANGNETISFGDIPTPLLGSERVMVDFVVPNFRSRVARGEVFFNSMTKTVEEVSAHGSTPLGWRNVGSSHSDRSTPGGWYNIADMAGNMAESEKDAGSGMDVSRLGVLAGTQARANVNDPTFQGMVFLAELRETIGFLRNPLRSWNDLLNRWKRAGRRKVRPSTAKTMSLASFITDNWLAYRYAVRPIIKDASDVMAAIEQQKKPPPVRYSARGRASDELHKLSTGVVPAWYSEITRESTHTFTASARAMILYEIATGYDHFGANLSQVPLTAWEVVPFSFVVDWFANVGTYVSAITPRAGVKELGACTTTQLVATHDHVLTREYNNGKLTYGNGAASLTRSRTSKAREPRIAGPALQFKPLPLSGDIGRKRILDLLAIGQQLLDSKLR